MIASISPGSIGIPSLLQKVTCGSKYEDRMTKEENAGLMESLVLRSIRGRDKERERQR